MGEVLFGAVYKLNGPVTCHETVVGMIICIRLC